MSAATIDGWRIPGYMRTWAYKSSVADNVSHEDALIHAKKCNTESSRGDEYAGLYHRARKCGASHAPASRHADACIHARVSASEFAEADWSPEAQCAPYEISARHRAHRAPFARAIRPHCRERMSSRERLVPRGTTL